MIFRIIKVSASVRPQLITLASTLITPDITKTSSNYCLLSTIINYSKLQFSLWNSTSLHVSSCKMFTFCDVLKKAKNANKLSRMRSTDWGPSLMLHTFRLSLYFDMCPRQLSRCWFIVSLIHSSEFLDWRRTRRCIGRGGGHASWRHFRHARGTFGAVLNYTWRMQHSHAVVAMDWRRDVHL